MKQFLIKIFIFFLVTSSFFVLYAYAGSILARQVYGDSAMEQIDKSFTNALNREYNLVFLGNSRVYHGIDPDVFPGQAYNFAHDNDSFNQCYYKLKYLLDNNVKIDTLCLGIDYFEFGIFSSTKNYCYDRYFSTDYQADYNDNSLSEQISNFQRVFFNHQFLLLKCAFKIVSNRGCLPDFTSYIKDNGQYIMFGSKGKPDDKVHRNSEMLDMQKGYFENILQLCSDLNIECILFMMPVRDGEMQSYEDEYLNEFDTYIQNTISPFGFKYINMSDNEQFKDYSLYDDITHFNSNGAKIFTSYFGKELNYISTK